MRNFFLGYNNDLSICLFSIYHLLLIFIVFLFVIKIILNKEKIINFSKKQKRWIRIILLILLLLNWILKRGSFIYYGEYNWRIHLDLGFCNFTSIMFFLYVLTGWKKIYSICYYMTFSGPLSAIFIPSFDISPLNYSFYSFIIVHHVIFIFNFIFMYMEGYKYNKKDFRFLLIFLFIYTFGVYLFNCIMGTNYNFPLAFVNDYIIDSLLIRILSYNNFTVYFTFYFVIIGLSFLGNVILKFLYKK